MLNDADYEWEHHVPILQSEGGLSEACVHQVKTRKPWQGWEDLGWEGDTDGETGVAGTALNERQRAVLAFTDAMTISVKVSE